MKVDHTDRRTAGDVEKIDESDRSQIVQHLRWTPKERLSYLLDMLAFEERAHRARRL